MPIPGIFASSMQVSNIVGAYDSLGSIVLSASTAAVTFVGIPQTYTHLQVRCFVRSDRAGASADNVYFQYNGDYANNYTYHYFDGNGASASANGGATVPYSLGVVSAAAATTGVFATNIVDIADYSNPNKYKTMRDMSGYDNNGSGGVFYWSGLWTNLAPITTFTALANIGSFIAGSRFDLYGIKGA